jgi:hypothetical protein
MGMRGSMVRSSYVVAAAGRMPHLDMGRALGGTFTVGAHSSASHVTVLGCGRHAARRIVVWPIVGPNAVGSGVAAGTETGVRGWGFPTIGG